MEQSGTRVNGKLFLNLSGNRVILKIQMRQQLPTKWLTSKLCYISLPVPPSNKVGLLFIFACYSYLCRQAVRPEMYRQKTAGLKLHIHPSAPPPFSFKLGRLPPCNTIVPHCYFIIFILLGQFLFSKVFFNN